MKNCMIIKHDSGKKEFFICGCYDCNVKPEKEIQTFYSFEHAIDSGWMISAEIKYCPPNKNYMFICPDCYNKKSGG